MDEMKQGLRLNDRLSPEISSRLPPLPFMDFDIDESASITPMQLVWDHPHKKLPKMEVQTSNLSLPHKKKNPN
jgi:hypothetical protein